MIQIHRVEGRDLRDALRRAKDSLGVDAVVLSQESVAGGGVTLSVTRAPAAKAALGARRSAGQLVGIAEEASGGGVVTAPAPPRSTPRVDVSDVERHLVAAGFSDELTRRVLAPVERMAGEGMHPIDAAAAVLGRLFQIAPMPKRQDQLRVMALVGPTGSGKTTTLAKLAVLLLKAGRRVAFATTDTYRVGAVDQLRAYAEVLEVPLYVASSPNELAASVAAASDRDVLLVDTAGRSPQDTEHLTRLARDLEVAGREVDLDALLVLSAAAGRGALAAARAAYAVLAPSSVVLTKTDETREAGLALEFCMQARLGLAFVCDGQDVNAHIHRPTEETFADLVLRGKVA